MADKTIGNHDVHVGYKGARFQIFAGSIKDYEVPKKNVLKALNRIVEEDVKQKSIDESDRGIRLEVLKDYIFKLG